MTEARLQPPEPTQPGRKVLILGINYAPEPIGIGPYTRGLAEGLARRGLTVSVVTAVPYYPQWRVYDGWSGRGLARSREEGVSVLRCPLYVPAQPSGLRRIAHLASFSLTSLAPALARAWRERPDVVVCIAPSLLSVPVAWLASRVAGARLWIHVQDFEVEAAFSTGLLDGGGMAGGLARWLENRLLRLGDRVSTISPQMCARLVAKGVGAERVRELRNWANAPAVDPAGSAAFREEWTLGARKVALYSGNIANKQGIEIVVEAARALARRDDLVFVICGEGPNRERLLALAHGLSNVRFAPIQPAARLGALLALASVHLLPQIAGAADLVLPSKLTNMLESGRPVVATADPGTGLYNEVDGCGLLVPPGDASALAAAIERLVDDPELAARLGESGRDRSRERWREAAIIDRFASELQAVCEPGGRAE